MHLTYRRPWARPEPINRRGKWIWAFVPRRTTAGWKWMCWLWRYQINNYADVSPRR